MDYYNILDIDENASKEEIRQAYDKQVNKFNIEIQDKKRAEKFLKLFKEAYDNLIEDREGKEKSEGCFDEELSALVKNISCDNKLESDKAEVEINNELSADRVNKYIEQTLLMNPEDVLKEIESQRLQSAYNDYYEENDYEEDYDNRIVKRSDNATAKKKSKSKNNKSTNSKKFSKADKNLDDERDGEGKNSNYERGKNNKNSDNVKKQKVIMKKQEKSNNILGLVLLPLKILALPIIAVLSLIIFVCKVISVASWLASKVIIVGAIGGAAIHGYQIYTGQAPMQWQIFALCLGAFIVSLFLPYIVKVVPSLLTSINNVLKSFVF